MARWRSTFRGLKMNKHVADLIRLVADEVEAAAISEAEIDNIELVIHHVRDLLKGGITDRCRQTKLMLRMLDRA